MNIIIYAHKLDGDQKRHLTNAVRAVNGAQAYFSLPHEILEVDLPDLGRIPPMGAIDALMSHLPAGNHGICVTSVRLGDNWFSHEGRQCSLITAFDWEGSFAPPSLRCYLVYELAQALLAFVADLSEEMQLRLVHEPPRGCIMDMCSHKPDIRLGMIAGSICADCRASLLRYATPEDAIDSIDRILRVVRAEAIGRPILTEPDLAFVVMRFSEHDENDNAYRHGIKPGLESVGIRAERADNVVTSSQILSNIRRRIDRSRFIVAKVDVNNLNVYFELGLAMGSDKSVLLVSERSLVLDLPIDLRNWECLTYSKGNYEELKTGVSDFFVQNYHFSRGK